MNFFYVRSTICIKLQLIVRHFICTNMIYYTKCRLINEFNGLNRFDYSKKVRNEKLPSDLSTFPTRDNFYLKKKTKKNFLPSFHSLLFAFLIVVK